MWNSSRRCSCSQTICREEPVFAGKVTCGVRNETSGQSWPSNTGATDHRVCLLTSWKTFLAGDFNPVTKVSESISSEVLLPTHQQAHMPSQPSPLHSHSIAAHSPYQACPRQNDDS